MSPYKPARQRKTKEPTLKDLTLGSIKKARTAIDLAKEIVNGEDVAKIENTKIVIDKPPLSPQKSPKKVARKLNGHTTSNKKISTVNKRNTNNQ